MVGNFWKTRTGWIGGGRADCGGRARGREADGRTGGRGAKERQTGGWGADGRTGGRHGEWRRTSAQADESGRGADRAD